VSLPGGVAIALVRDPRRQLRRVRGAGLGRRPEDVGGFRPLFNGRDLSGWRTLKNGVWTVEDGAIVGRQGENSGGGWLVTEKPFGDFEVRFRFRMSRGGNSGVAFRFLPTTPPRRRPATSARSARPTRSARRAASSA